MTDSHPIQRSQASALGQPEPLLTIRDAAEALGLHPWALRRAIKAGTVPGYTPFNSRTRVRLSEVLAAIEASKIGGRHEHLLTQRQLRHLRSL